MAKSLLLEGSVHVLVCLFGISSWIAINGLWVETPIIVNILPEKWKLASHISVVTHFANLGPLIYSLLLRYYSRSKLEPISINTINAIGITSLFLMIFLWDKTSFIDGKQRSVSFLVLTFFVALVDATSTVLYIPYVSTLSSRFMISHLIGQSLSGLFPSLIAIIQGSGQDEPHCPSNSTNNFTTSLPEISANSSKPLFSVSVFFGMMTFLASVSWISFLLLSNFTMFQLRNEPELENERGKRKFSHNRKKNVFVLSEPEIYCFFVLEFLIATIIYGLLPSIQPYSLAMFGTKIYHLTVILAVISNPFGTLMGSFFPRMKLLPISLLGAFSCAGYILESALHSPNRLFNTNPGQYIILIAWILNNFLFSYSRACITRILRQQANNHRMLFLGGAFQQTGSFVSALITFFIVNFTKTFASYDPCKDTQL